MKNSSKLDTNKSSKINKTKKHNSNYCNVPFCKDCWAIIRSNIMAVKGVAGSLIKSKEQNND